MGLAFGCVFVLTLLLIADIGACLLVSVCVLSTLVSDSHSNCSERETIRLISLYRIILIYFTDSRESVDIFVCDEINESLSITLVVQRRCLFIHNRDCNSKAKLAMLSVIKLPSR